MVLETVPVVVPAAPVRVLPIFCVPEIVALAIVGAANTSAVATEVLLALPPVLVTVITTLMNFRASLEVKT